MHLTVTGPTGRGSDRKGGVQRSAVRCCVLDGPQAEPARASRLGSPPQPALAEQAVGGGDVAGEGGKEGGRGLAIVHALVGCDTGRQAGRQGGMESGRGTAVRAEARTLRPLSVGWLQGPARAPPQPALPGASLTRQRHRHLRLGCGAAVLHERHAPRAAHRHDAGLQGGGHTEGGVAGEGAGRALWCAAAVPQHTLARC